MKLKTSEKKMKKHSTDVNDVQMAYDSYRFIAPLSIFLRFLRSPGLEAFITEIKGALFSDASVRQASNGDDVRPADKENTDDLIAKLKNLHI